MHTKVIGVAGTNGSGKDTVMSLLRDHYGYLFVSATDLLGAELESRGEPTDREHKSALSAEWRREHGMGVIVKKAYEVWQRHAEEYPGGLVVGSLRHPGEADEVHALGGTVIWVDADARMRYDRIQASAAARGRAEEDAVSFERFQEEEAREMHHTGDAATLDMASVKDRADVFLDNGGDEITSFQASVVKALAL